MLAELIGDNVIRVNEWELYDGHKCIYHGSMGGLLRQFLSDDRGQDLTEYFLLLMFVVLASAAIFLGSGSGFTGIWSLSNSQVTAASAIAAS